MGHVPGQPPWEAGRWHPCVAHASVRVSPWRLRRLVPCGPAGAGAGGALPQSCGAPRSCWLVFAVNPPSPLIVMQDKLCAGGFGALVNYCRR